MKMKKTNQLIALGAATLLLIPSSVAAATFATNETITIDQNLPDDLYAGGNRIDVTAAVDGDVYAGGETVTISGPVAGDIHAAGNVVTITGRADDDMFVAGQFITIESPRADDVFVAGQTIGLAANTVIEGDLYAAGNRLQLAGTINGTVRAAGQEIVIPNGAVINGDLITYGQNEPQVGADVTITGTTTHHQTETSNASERMQATLLNWVRSIITWFVIGLIILLLIPHFVRSIVQTAQTKTAPAFGLGVLWLLLAAPAALFAVVTIIGIPLAFAIIMLTILVIILGIIFAVILTGAVTARLLTKQPTDKLTWTHVLLGAVIFKSLGFIPFIGSLIALLIVVTALGATLMTLWQRLATPDQTAT